MGTEDGQYSNMWGVETVTCCISRGRSYIHCIWKKIQTLEVSCIPDKIDDFYVLVLRKKPESFFIERQLTTEICKMYSFSFIQLIIIFTISLQFGINLNKKCLQITTTGFFKWWMVLLYTWKSLNNTRQYQFYWAWKNEYPKLLGWFKQPSDERYTSLWKSY